MAISRRRFIKATSGTLAIGVAAGSAAVQVSAAESTQTTDFVQRVRVNQAKLTSELKPLCPLTLGAASKISASNTI